MKKRLRTELEYCWKHTGNNQKPRRKDALSWSPKKQSPS